MLQTSDHEREILLGNKQLLGIFFVAAVLLGIAFTGGYMLGRGSAGKKPLGAAGTKTEAAASSASGSQGGETHSVPPDDGGVVLPSQPARKAVSQSTEVPLGSRKRKTVSASSAPDVETSAPKSSRSDGFVPEVGQEFLQVTAVAHEDANAVAAVLRRKGFHAHAVPKPGNANLYRVLVGPIRDAGELSSTRDALRKTGFRDVIVQHYQ